MAVEGPPVFGLESGGMTSQELEEVSRKNAIATIRRWEEVCSTPLKPDHRAY